MRFITLSILPFIRSLLPIQTEKNITLSAYTGLWYQVATSRSTALLGTGIDYTNVSALYNITNTSDLSVFNHGYDGNMVETSIQGYSYANMPLYVDLFIHSLLHDSHCIYLLETNMNI